MPGAGRVVPVHYVRGNAKVWTPPAVICWDTETYRTPTDGGELQTLRLWVASLVDRRQQEKVPPGRHDGTGETADSLADWFDQATMGRRTVWAYAHNLTFDLVVTRLPHRLIERGWTVSEFSFLPRACWLKLSKGRRHLTLTDFFTVIARPLAVIGDVLKIPKPPLPDNDDSSDAWYARCEADVNILRTAALELLDWWDREELGQWSLTGASSGSHAMRHMIEEKSILVDPDLEATTFERKAIHGGRRDGTRCGTWYEHLYANLDFVAAYPTIAAHLPLPSKRVLRFDSLPLDHKWLALDSHGVVAEVEVVTDVPRYPLRFRKHAYYPVGRFRTSLAGPELARAVDLGEVVRIGPGRLYQLSDALAPWAEWVLRLQHGNDPSAPAVAALAAKGWGRSVLGRFAAHGRETRNLGPSAPFAWRHRQGLDVTLDAETNLVEMLGQTWLVTMTGDGFDAFPAVWAWIESAVRVRLSRMLEELGETVWITCDTDGCLVDAEACYQRFRTVTKTSSDPRPVKALVEGLCGQLARTTWPLVPAVKGWSHNLELRGPQHVITDEQRKMAGVRRDATRVDRDTWEGINWPGLSWQMTHGSMAGYVNPRTVWHLPGLTLSRWVLDDGEALPVEARINEQGRSELVPWDQSGWATLDQGWPERQSPTLAGLY